MVLWVVLMFFSAAGYLGLLDVEDGLVERMVDAPPQGWDAVERRLAAAVWGRWMFLVVFWVALIGWGVRFYGVYLCAGGG